ncbi:hypothetical protein BGX28_003137 [Mortierella sp. GBA30]|nr:hypothetical protein BGX28_003137 [Mortierella sp. GBA30]
MRIPRPTGPIEAREPSQIPSSLVDVRQLDSGVDLQEAPKPVNRRSNRDFRIIQPAEMEEFNLQESIRHSQTAHKPLPPKPQVFLNNNIVEDEDESYFGDILDKYCNSDDDIPSTKHTSVSRSSRPTTASATAGLTKSALPPTPTPAISRSQGAAAPSNETARDYHSFADRSSRERNESNRSVLQM